MSIVSDLKAVFANAFLHGRLGDRGERAAERFLRRKRRMVILERGYRNFVGEIDLIAVERQRRSKVIVFVEVKTRASDRMGLPAEAVDDRKERQITGTAMVWLKQHRLLEHRWRFDIVSVIWPEDASTPEITHIENAFEPAGQGQMFQ